MTRPQDCPVHTAQDETLPILQHAYRDVGIGNPKQLHLDAFFSNILRPAIDEVVGSWIFSDEHPASGVTESMEAILRCQLMAGYRAKISTTLSSKPYLGPADWLLEHVREGQHLEMDHARLILYVREVLVLLIHNMRITTADGKMTKTRLSAATQLAKGHGTAFTVDFFDGTAIDHALRTEGISMSLIEIRQRFTPSLCSSLADQCPRDPLHDGAVRVARNFKEKLSDEQIKALLDAEGIFMPIRSIQRMLPQDARFLLATKSIQSVDRALLRLVLALRGPLSDEALRVAFRVEGVEIKSRLRGAYSKIPGTSVPPDQPLFRTDYPMQDIVPSDIRLNLAINNPNDPQKRLKEAAQYCFQEMSDEKLMAILSEENLNIVAKTLSFIFPSEVRLKWAVDFFVTPHGKDPLKRFKGAIRVVKKIIDHGEILTAFQREKVKIEASEIDRLMPPHQLLKIAVAHPGDCLSRALKQIGRKNSSYRCARDA